MPIVRQLRESYPWIADSLTAMVAGATGMAALLPFAPFARGTLSSPHEHSWEHPLRRSILKTLERSPGIHFRELQRSLRAANGTLRHHLRILENERSVSLVPVNGRICYYGGSPAQLEILLGTGVTDQATAASMMPVGLSAAQRQIVAALSNSPNPPSQAQLAREMGRSRTTVNSAIGILRSRGIVNQGTLSLAPHLDSLGLSKVEYPWLEIRKELA
jgi:predicted transcriptional regulator